MGVASAGPCLLSRHQTRADAIRRGILECCYNERDAARERSISVLRMCVRLCDLQRSVFDGFLAGGRAWEKKALTRSEWFKASRPEILAYNDQIGSFADGGIGLAEGSGQYYFSSNRIFDL